MNVSVCNTRNSPKRSLQNFKSFKIMKKTITLVLLGLLCSIGNVWADTFTVDCTTTSSDALFSVTETTTQYDYSSKWTSYNLIEMDKGVSITVTNVKGATITAVTAEGVADNNSNQTVNFTISDGTTTAETSSGSWNNRKTSTSLTSKALNATNVAKLKTGVGQTYTITNKSSSSYDAGVRFVITYTLPKYTVTHTLSNVTATSGATGANAATKGTAYNAVFAASSGYNLPAEITVTIGGDAATVVTDYTWNSETGAFQVPAAKVTGAIVVTVTGVAASSAPILSGSASSPAASETNVAVSGSGYLKFNKNLASLTAAKITISPSSNGEELSSIAIDGEDASKVNFSWSGLKKETEYTINLAANAVSDGTDGNSASSLSFTTIEKTALTAAWSSSDPSFNKGADASGSLPTFSVTGGELGTSHSIVYSKQSGDNFVTFDASDGITAINTSSAGTETIRATVTLLDEDNYSIATTTYDCEITIVEVYTLTYNANGGSGTMADLVSAGSVSLTPNTYTKSGYTFIGWATSQANANAGIVAYADGAAYSLSADATLYAIWGENYYEFTPKVVAENENVGITAIVLTSTGGTMQNAQADETEGRLVYTPYGLKFAGSSNSKVTITLTDVMKVGSKICATFWDNSNKANRGVDILNAAGTDKGDWYFTSDAIGVTKTFIYEVVEGDGFEGTRSFSLKRKGDAYLKSLTVVNAQPGGVISGAGWTSYATNKRLDLSSISGGEAYVASAASGNTVTLTKSTAKVAAGTGLMIKGTPGATFTINTTTDAATFSGDNFLVGVTTSTSVAASTSGAYHYVFGYDKTDASVYGFYNLTAATTVPAGKAYLETETALTTGGPSAPAAIRIVDEENNATSIETLGSDDKAVKFIQNGQLLILRDGITYDALGRKIR